MLHLILPALLTALVAAPAHARVINVNSCVMTIGSFCPVETGAGLLLAVALFGLAGFPLRWGIRRHIQQQAATNPDYRPSDFTAFLYRNAGRMTLLLAGIALFIVFAAQS